MIPTIDKLLSKPLKFKIRPSKNYKMNFERENINGFRDNADAMQQVIYKILNTERYQYLIYSWNYGIELKDLFGRQVNYVCPELERRIIDALIQDDRIEYVDSFSFDIETRHIVAVTFVAHTIFGDVKIEKVVNY